MQQHFVLLVVEVESYGFIPFSLSVQCHTHWITWVWNDVECVRVGGWVWSEGRRMGGCGVRVGGWEGVDCEGGRMGGCGV